VHRPLPVAVLASRPSPAAVYRVVAVDRRGRLAERAVMRALGWTPDSSLDVAETPGALVVRAEPAGPFRTTRHGCASACAFGRRPASIAAAAACTSIRVASSWTWRSAVRCLIAWKDPRAGRTACAQTAHVGVAWVAPCTLSA
jgi:hypothetical protein